MFMALGGIAAHQGKQMGFTPIVQLAIPIEQGCRADNGLGKTLRPCSVRT